MSNLRHAAQQALEALESKYIVNCGAWRFQQDRAITALRAALAEDALQRLTDVQQEMELVIDCPRCGHCCPQRKPLTDEFQIAEALRRYGLTLVKTAKGYEVMNLGQIISHGIKGEV